MKQNRCPWCGDASIPLLRRRPFVALSRYGRPEPCCPSCEKGVMLSKRRKYYSDTAWVWLEMLSLLLPCIALACVAALLAGYRPDVALPCLLVSGGVTVVVAVVKTVRSFGFSHWTRYRFSPDRSADRREMQGAFLWKQSARYVELCDIDTPYIITTEAPLPLRTESIYPVRLPIGARELFAGDVALNSEVVMYFECVGDRTYRAGFIRPDELHTEKLTADMSFTVWVDDDKKIVATIKKLP